MNENGVFKEKVILPSRDSRHSPVEVERGPSDTLAVQEAAPANGGRLVFPFGKNWERFLARIDEERVDRARESLTRFMNMRDFTGRSFIDIGCGSGLFSYAAFLLGADRIVSFDADPFSVSCARYLHEKAGRPAHWSVLQGSVLDKEFLNHLEGFDIVYSWGVLHHTGNMWEAVRNSAALVSKKGFYYIALYNKADGRSGSEHWLKVKRFYNTSALPMKRLIEWYYTFSHPVGRNLLKFKNPFKALRHYGGGRGMHWRTDLVDWLGGYPYEFATVEEVFTFIKSEFPAFTLANIKTEPGLGNNWFLFRNDS
jgi:2-polyprenyl-3-methyl-5-hydroxy-6-metoxy-1,4-benzoquinol methylase